MPWWMVVVSGQLVSLTEAWEASAIKPLIGCPPPSHHLTITVSRSSRAAALDVILVMLPLTTILMLPSLHYVVEYQHDLGRNWGRGPAWQLSFHSGEGNGILVMTWHFPRRRTSNDSTGQYVLSELPLGSASCEFAAYRGGDPGGRGV